MARLLLDCGADAQLQRRFGKTAMKVAKASGHKRCMALLASCGFETPSLTPLRYGT